MAAARSVATRAPTSAAGIPTPASALPSLTRSTVTRPSFDARHSMLAVGGGISHSIWLCGCQPLGLAPIQPAIELGVPGIGFD
jgi:hypothetical protein